ncbi:hypothetical protein GCM10007108_15890 [Thermogymnomonas acidicola]|uniref:MFS transporter n=1 Tax=Thermogymnomonas acidicola TaxID=399579 RepID=A0AA37F9Y5_9ARCH|nr:MFS transporter [Thermogymnomonas acidicola]GGM78523.1 hypothetical protein GCM10007108_15890 [Thermogymnomonas acidicola]
MSIVAGMTIFSFSLYPLLSYFGIPIEYAALGLSIGQFAVIFTAMLTGRLIDAGHSYRLLTIGSFFYPAVFFAITLSAWRGLIPLVVVPVGCFLIVIAQNVFRASLNSFIAKVARNSNVGANYSRVYTLEVVGGIVAFALIIFLSSGRDLVLSFMATSAVMFASPLIAFTAFRSGHRAFVEESKGFTRTRFSENLRNLRRRSGFVAPSLTAKAIMSVTLYGFSYFYVLQAERMDIPLRLSVLFLLLSYVLGIPWARLGERFIDSHPGFGKMYVVLMALSDVFSYSLIYLAVEHGMVWLYLSSVLIGSVGPFVVSGALAYEAKAIGKENRGTYASIQKLVVGTTGLVTTLPLALVFQRSPQELWLIVAVLSVVAFLVTLAVPGPRALKERMGVSID